MRKLCLSLLALFLLCSCQSSPIKDKEQKEPMQSDIEVKPLVFTDKEYSSYLDIECDIDPFVAFSESTIFFDDIYPIYVMKEEPILHMETTKYYYVERDGKYGIMDETGSVIVPYIQLYMNSLFYGVNEDGTKTLELTLEIEEEEQHLLDVSLDRINHSDIWLGYGHGIFVANYVFETSTNKNYLELGCHEGISGYQPVDKVDASPLDIVNVSVVKSVDCGYEKECDVDNMIGTTFMDSKGSILTSKYYMGYGTLNSELIMVQDKETEKWGAINHKGEEVIPCKYDEIIDGSIKGMVAARLNDKYGVIGSNGTEVVPFEYDCISPYKDDSFLMRKENHWTLRTFE